ncbi:MAG: M1 family metallopeptidase [Rubrivivax sp.]
MVLGDWRNAWWIGVAMLIGASAPAFAQDRFDFDRTPGNLPKTVVPVRYALQLDLDPADSIFMGVATIEIDVREPASTIVLHSRDLHHGMSELRQGATVRGLSPTPGPFPQTLAFTPDDAAPIAPGRYTLVLQYRGNVNATGEGLFRAEYMTTDPVGGHTGEPTSPRPARMLATQLEAIDARSMFPGFDEPAFRAVFELTVRTAPGWQVFSNMPERTGSPQSQGGAVLHRFEPTPPMPSYLLSVSVGRFDIVTGTAAGVPLRILTAPGKAAQAAYAMRVTEQVLPFYNAYFGVPFALPKLDQLAVPSTRIGAMEDWGLISYSEPTVLFDPARSSPSIERQVYSVMAHEISHQWFGDLVTAASWEEIWLNEAFATWMADKATAHFNPQWHLELDRRLPIDESMVRDAGASTRPIRSGPVRETAVFDVFDDITYTKGGAVLDMLEAWLGPAAFQRGLQSYMVDRKFSNATAGDLWFHIGVAGKRDVAAVASSWTDQPGFPLVTATSRCQGGRTAVALKQQRFGDKASAAVWQVPVRLARGRQSQVVLLDRPGQQVDLPGCNRAPLVVNAGGIGYYRVRYAADAQQGLQQAFPRLAAADQVMLLSDAFALAQLGEQPMAQWFALARQVPQVRGAARTTLFDQLGVQFRFLGDALTGTEAEPLLHRTARRLFAPELERLGYADRSDDSPQTRKLRGRLIDRLAYHRDAEVVAHAVRLFEQAESGGTPLAPSIRAGVIRAVGSQSDPALFKGLLQHLRTAAGEEDRWLYASALARGHHAERARSLLASALEGITTPNIAAALPEMVATHSPFTDLAYEFTLANWHALAKLAGSNFGARNWLLPAAAQFNDRARIAPMRAAQTERAGPDGNMPAAQRAARIGLLADVRDREASALVALWSDGASPGAAASASKSR